ncbi:MAG: hypothetical protein V4658_06435 [Bacteroidota bacterium]
MFGLGRLELIIIFLLVFLLFLLVPFSLGYYIGLSRGRRENRQRQFNNTRL